MAIDTRDRRASVLGLLKPYGVILPYPDVLAEDQYDRQQLAYSYRAILAEALYDVRPIVFTYADTMMKPALTVSPELVPGMFPRSTVVTPALAGSAQMQQ